MQQPLILLKGQWVDFIIITDFESVSLNNPLFSSSDVSVKSSVCVLYVNYKHILIPLYAYFLTKQLFLLVNKQQHVRASTSTGRRDLLRVQEVKTLLLHVMPFNRLNGKKNMNIT